MGQDVNQEVEIDLINLVMIILRKWKIISLIIIVFTLLASGYAYLMLEDTYVARSSMIVQVDNEGNSDYTNLLMGQKLIDTYNEIAVCDRVLDELRLDLGIDLSNGTLKDMITVTSVSNTLIINVSVESTDKILARDIANGIVNIVKDLSSEYDGLENAEILDVAKTPISPSGPNRMLYIVIGMLIGGIIGVGIVLGFEFLDKSIKTGKDVEDILGLRLLGVISEYNTEGDAR